MTWSRISRSGMLALCFAACLPVFSQSGSTGLYTDFDPTKVVPSPPLILPPGALSQPYYPVIPLSDYLQRKDLTGKSPLVTGPPTVTFSPPVSQPQTLSLATAPTVNVEGIADQAYQPSSSNIAAGPQDVLQIINSAVARYDKAGNVTNQLALSDWFQPQLSLVCSSGFRCLIADPSVRYDQIHGRFMLLAEVFDEFAGTSYLLLSVSNGSSYTGGWRNWALNARLDGQTGTFNWSDFPQIGYDDKAIYISTLQFSMAFHQFQYSRVRIIRKSDLFNPFTTFLQWNDIVDLRHQDGSKASTIQPVIVRGGQTSNSYYLVSASDASNASFLTLFRIDDPIGTARLNSSTLRGIWNYSYPIPAFQPNSQLALDTGQSSILKAVMRDGVIYAAQNASTADNPTTVVYTRIDTRLQGVTLQAQLANGTFYYPAFDVPASHGRTNAFPNKLISGTSTDATGALVYAGLRDVKAGEDAFNVISNGAVRWGDYFGASIDPIQGGMWVSGSYARMRVNGVSSYGNRNAYFPWVTQNQFADIPADDSSRDYINVVGQWVLPFGCTAGNFCPNNNVTREQLAVYIIRTLYGDQFPITIAPYFTDVPDGSPNFSYIQKLRDLNLLAGCTPTTFCPSNLVTRSEAATAIVRAKMYAIFGDTFSFNTTPFFTDVPGTDPAFPHVQKLREFGFTAGCGVNLFCPTRTVTRRELAVFLVRAFLN